MKARYFFLLAAMVLLASCSKELAAPEISISKAKTVIEVGISPATKTYLGESEAGVRKVYWSDGDQIAVNGTASYALSGLADNTASVAFTFDGVLSTPYEIVYPASVYEDATHITLPAVQTYKSDGFADGMFPMAGYSADGSSVTLHHLCAIVKISVKRATTDADADNLVAVRFKGRNDEQVSGSFTIDYQNVTLAPAASVAEADKVVKVAKNKATSTSEAVDYFIVIPAGTYSNGFDVVVMDKNGHVMTKSKTSSWTAVAGKLYSMPEFEFVPTGTELGVEITNAQELIQFAEDYNNKVFESLGDETLIATLTDDITFDATSSAAFNATGGIGMKNNLFGATEDYYFNGTVNGGGHTISGLVATVPVFAAIGDGGAVSNLTIEDNCSFTFTHPNTTELDAGALVGYNKGVVKNVVVAADVTLVASEVSQETCLGGIAGRETVGTIDNCSYSGAITIPADFQSAAKKIQIGGIVGRISNPSGIVQNTDFEGTIDNQGQLIAASETTDFKNYPQLMIGGIVGLNSGTIDNCSTSNHATGVTVTLNDGSDHNYTGTVVTHSTNAYHYAIAGIAGRNDGTINDCTNNANVVNLFSAERGTSGNMNGRYLIVGGIVGYNSATVSGSDNYGSIVNRANPKVHYVGGVVGRNVEGTISSCDNKSTGSIGVGTSHLTPYGARMLYLGGVIASNEGGTVSNIHNAGAISVSRIENTTGIFTRIGGVVGYSTSTIDGSADGGTITNSGAIAQSSGIGKCATPTDANDYGLFLGGIIGYTTAGVKNVSNSGNVTYTCTNTGTNSSGSTDGGAQYVYLGGVAGKIKAASSVDVEACSNTAKVTFTATASFNSEPKNDNQSQGVLYAFNYLGGIVGYAINAEFKGNCTNSGVVQGGDGTANRNTSNTFWVGGIVGYLTGSSSISNCSLIGSGQSYNNHFSNRGETTYDSPTSGGIAGHVVGESGTPISISNCSVANTATVTTRRGACGGIVGMSQYATISSCTVPVNFSGSGYVYGGIAAEAQNTTISDCSYTGSTIQSSQLKFAGGILGFLDSGSIVDGCRSSATTVNKNGTAVTTTGGIAGKSVASSTIKNCHYTSTIGKICGDSNFTDDGSNVADL